MKLLNVAHLNVHSLTDKFNEFKQYVLDSDHDIVAVSETWLSPDIENYAININGFTFLRTDRVTDTWGGGVGIYIKNNIKITTLSLGNNNLAIEQHWIKCKINKYTVAIGVVYRRQEYSCNEFLNTLEDSLTEVTPIVDYVICLGDFNINMLEVDNPVLNLNQILLSLNLQQIINEPTRITKNSKSLIDLIVITKNLTTRDSGVIPMHHLSDHSLTFCVIDISVAKSIPISHTFRDFKNLDIGALHHDFQLTPWNLMYNINNIDDKLIFLNNCLLTLFDIHAPFKTATFTKSNCPWLTDTIKTMISLRNKAYSKFKKTSSAASWEYYKDLRNLTNSAIQREKKAYLESQINTNNSKLLWKRLKNLDIHNRRNRVAIPEALCDANQINKYFIDSANLHFQSNFDELRFYNETTKAHIDNKFQFSLITADIVFKTLNEIKTTAAGCDNINVTLLKYCCPYILPIITHIINCCIEQSFFPSMWKQANILPLAKVQQPNELKHLRPISILPTLSKVFEKILNLQIRMYLDKHNILPSNQSGFRQGYSCGTLLLSVMDDILTATDNNKLTVLILLDYTKAFDTINHDILLSILNYIGFDASAILLMESYLKGRSQRVILNNQVSNQLFVECGVPQGSILGPLLFTIYTSNFNVSLKFCKFYQYADDTQLLYSFDPKDIDIANNIINEDLNRLTHNSEIHFLRLNPSKSSVMLFGKNKIRETYANLLNIQINHTPLAISNYIKNLGLQLDTSLRFKEHISAVIRKAYGKLKIIYKNKPSLNKTIRTMLCESLILSNFNYCDIIYGPCLDVMDKIRIQKVQNSCLRLIFNIRKYDHISYKLQEVKWLNMQNRRILHAAVLFHKLVITKKPPYLYNKIRFRSDVHNINIRRKDMLTPPLHKSALFERSFSYNIARIYNNVPSELKNKTIQSFRNCYFNSLFIKQISLV